MNTILKHMEDRLEEPSSWAGLATIALSLTSVPQIALPAQIAAGIFGLVAVLLQSGATVRNELASQPAVPPVPPAAIPGINIATPVTAPTSGTLEALLLEAAKDIKQTTSAIIKLSPNSQAAMVARTLDEVIEAGVKMLGDQPNVDQ